MLSIVHAEIGLSTSGVGLSFLQDAPHKFKVDPVGAGLLIFIELGKRCHWHTGRDRDRWSTGSPYLKLIQRHDVQQHATHHGGAAPSRRAEALRRKQEPECGPDILQKSGQPATQRRPPRTNH